MDNKKEYYLDEAFDFAFTDEEKAHFDLINIFKYILRHNHKGNSHEDILKAIAYAKDLEKHIDKIK